MDHNKTYHNLDYEEKSIFSNEIDKELNFLKGRVKTYQGIVDLINFQFNSYFNLNQIKYRIQKLCKETKGKAHQDAYEFVQLAKEDATNNGAYFAFQINESNEFDKCIYLSNTMLLYSNYFPDIIIVDSTYRRNRFNLALVNVLGVNNYGKNISLAFGLLSSETKENYIWFFSHLKAAWGTNIPKNCITDEDESIQQGIAKNFGCKLLLCGWHLQKNFISKFSNLSKIHEELYKKILMLPFVSSESKFQEVIEKIYDSDHVSDTQIEYLEAKLAKKENWAKFFVKKEFSGGVSTTSRVEGLHSVQKKYLTSALSLKKVFYSFHSLENQQISRFYEEFHEKNKIEAIQDVNSLKTFKDNYSLYVYKRILHKYKLAIVYVKESTNNPNVW